MLDTRPLVEDPSIASQYNVEFSWIQRYIYSSWEAVAECRTCLEASARHWIQVTESCIKAKANADLEAYYGTIADEAEEGFRHNNIRPEFHAIKQLWCSSARRQHQIPTTPVRVGCSSVQPVTAARNLWIYLDGDVSMHTHMTTTVRACFAMLRQIQSVRHSLFHVQPCWPCFGPLSLINWTSAALWRRVHLMFYCDDSSQS